MMLQSLLCRSKSPIRSDKLLLDIPHVEGVMFNIKLVRCYMGFLIYQSDAKYMENTILM